MVSWPQLRSATLAVLVSLSRLGYALPTVDSFDDVIQFNSSDPYADAVVLDSRQSSPKVPLRILPLGASIMSGVGASVAKGENGLRKNLRDALRLQGWEVNMVGTKRRGNMVDNNHEAVGGDTIDMIEARVKNVIAFKPNVVIINGGTNDATGNVKIPGAGGRMSVILDDLWNAPGMANTCIMLSTLWPITQPDGMANRPFINVLYRNLVKQRAAEGKCIYLAEMDQPSFIQVPQDMFDDRHPNDVGHKKMAAIFLQAINQAAAAGRIQAPPPLDLPVSNGVCDKFAGTGIDAGGLTQRGIGTGDETYSHNSEGKGVLWEWESDKDADQWRFARLFSRNYDDLLGWFEVSSTQHAFAAWANSGDGQGKFNRIADVQPALFCNPPGANFIDMNGDGLDDLVCIGPDGNAYMSINQGDGNRAAGKPPTFKDWGKILDNKGFKQERVVLADIDGDGRGDYGIINDDGDVHFWRNGGTTDSPEYWQDLGKRFVGFEGQRNEYDGAKKTYEWVRFEDINGDGRDDGMVMSYYGATKIWTNARSCKRGDLGDGLNVAWRQGFHVGESTGWAITGISEFRTPDEPDLRPRIHFARIYGQSTVFGNLPKQDYTFMEHEKKGSKHMFRLHVWKNNGVGGTKLPADGDRYCNMAGHSDGREDYVWMWSTGKMELYLSRGKSSISDTDPGGWWDPSPGVIWTPPHDMNRRNLHLADWDGDGDCDIIYVAPDGGGVAVYINKYLETGKWNFVEKVNAAPSLSCEHKPGLGFHDYAVRFADLTGNKRADYLCLAPDGKVTGFVQDDHGEFEKIPQIKYAEPNKDRANLRWADVNGDGLDDMIWTEKFSGDAKVWYNDGRGKPSDNKGSSFKWRVQDKDAYVGNCAGTCTYYPDLNGDNRADQHCIQGTFDNTARTQLSPSCGLTDVTGDDSVWDGDLPTPPDYTPPPTGQPCTAGTGPGDIESLCIFVCSYDLCLPPCTCTARGTDYRTPASLRIPDGAANSGGDQNVNVMCHDACDADFCPPKTCNSGDWGRVQCSFDPSKPESWQDSRAADLVDGYISVYGADNWLARMDVMYNLQRGFSSLECNSFSSEKCPAPDSTLNCYDWSSSSFWYVRFLAANLLTIFNHLHEKLQDTAIYNLATVDKMVADFKTTVPDSSWLNNVFANTAITASLASGLATAAGGVYVEFFAVVGALFYYLGANPTAPVVVDLDSIKTEMKAAVGRSFTAVNSRLEELLPAIFGNTNDDKLLADTAKFLSDKKLLELKGSTNTAKLLSNGVFMSSVTSANIQDGFERSITGMTQSILGHILSGLQYLVVSVLTSEAACSKTPGTWYRKEKGDCFYLVRRPSGKSTSESLDQPTIDKITGYGIDMVEMYKNVAACNNANLDPNRATDLYLGPDKYPPCFFGIVYIDGQDKVFPLGGFGIKPNRETLPDWAFNSGDQWVEDLEQFCRFEENHDTDDCKYCRGLYFCHA